MNFIIIFASFSHHFFIQFSCIFGTPFQRPFLEGPGANLSSKVRFWSDFRFSWGAKIDPWADIFGQQDVKGAVVCRARRIREPTWAQIGAENDPRINFHWFLYRFGSIWKRFWTSWDGFSWFLHMLQWSKWIFHLGKLNCLLWVWTFCSKLFCRNFRTRSFTHFQLFPFPFPAFKPSSIQLPIADWPNYPHVGLAGCARRVSIKSNHLKATASAADP